MAATKVRGSAKTTRLRKGECNACGYTIRLSRRWIAVGMPECPCGAGKLSCPEIEDAVLCLSDAELYLHPQAAQEMRREEARAMRASRKSGWKGGMQPTCGGCHRFIPTPKATCGSCGFDNGGRGYSEMPF